MSDARVLAAQIEAIPGDVGGIRDGAKRLSDTATAITSSIAQLRTAITAADEHESDALDALRDEANDAIPHLEKIHGRYETAGSALSTFADALEDAQTSATKAMDTRETSLGEVDRYDSMIADAEQDARTAEPDATADANMRVADLYRWREPHEQALRDAHTLWSGATVAVTDAADKARGAIDGVVESDDVNDSRMDNLKDWVNKHAKVISIVKNVMSAITTVLGIASIFFPALAPFALAAGLVTLGLSTLLAASGSGSWLDVGLDVIAVATLGVGAAAGAMVKGSTSALQATRASRLAWQSTKSPSIFKTLVRPVRAVFAKPGAAARVADDFAHAVPAGLKLEGTPKYTWDLVKTVGKARSVDGARFEAILSNAHLGAGGFVDDALLALGRGGQKAANGAFHIANVATGIGWHDDAAGALADIPVIHDSPVGDVLGGYVDAWRQVDGATVAPVPASW